MSGPKLSHPLLLAERLLERSAGNPAAAAVPPTELAARALGAALELHRLSHEAIKVDGETVADLTIDAEGRLWATLTTTVVRSTVGPADSMAELTAAVRFTYERCKDRYDPIERLPTPEPRSVAAAEEHEQKAPANGDPIHALP